VAYRAGLFKAKRLPGAVISVGNLTTGGTGKTPMVIWLAQRLHDEGRRVGILTRGYKGSADDARGEPQSDEVAIFRERLAHHVSIGVGAGRYENGMTLARHGIEWFVLDDGFQHMQLARDVDIVMIDASDPFGGGRLLPAGLLREPRSALRRADIVAITRSEHAPAVEAVVRRFTQAPIFYAATRLMGIFPFGGGSDRSGPLSTDQITKQSWFAFCGIGNPRGFVDDLSRWGVRLCATRTFQDHHKYSQRDAREIEADARDAGATALICTEKDVFNLRDAKFGMMPAFFAQIELHIGDADGFWRTLQLTIARHRGASAA
jgi:tetraacyldisaccharide 4'-kinase